MRFSRVHSVIAGATLVAVLAGSSLVATAEAAPQPVGTQAHHVVSPHGLVPAADPTTALTVLGKLGAVQSLIGQLVGLAGKTPPDPAAIKAVQDQLTAAVADLQKSLPTPPLPVSGKGGVHAPKGLPVPIPVPNPLGDALTKLQGDITALVAALTSVPPDPGKVTAALTSTVTDLLAVVTNVVASLGLPLPPLPVTHH